MRQFRTSYRRWHDSIHRTWRSESMFKQVCAGQQVHAVVRSIETIDVSDVL